MSLEKQILEIINAKPGQLSREIATDLGADKKTINNVLYGKLKGLVWQDKRYQWYPKDQSHQKEQEGSVSYAKTPLAKVARYYLACIGQEETGISVFAANLVFIPTYGVICCLRRGVVMQPSTLGLQWLCGAQVWPLK